MDIKEKNHQHIDYKWININQFETSIGASKSYWRKTKSISANVVIDICRIYTDLNLEWLYRGNGEMIKDSTSKASSTIAQSTSVSSIMIPFEEYKKSIAEKDEIIKDQAHKIGMLEHELTAFHIEKTNCPRNGECFHCCRSTEKYSGGRITRVPMKIIWNK